MKHIAINLLSVSLLVLGLQVQAQSETGSKMQELISNLRAQHQELKAQVTAGEITKEEAHATWQELLAEAKAQKEEYFADRVAKAEARIADLETKRPELAEQIRKRVEVLKSNREAAQAERERIRTQVQNQEITREEAMQLRRDLQTNIIEQRQEIRSEFESFKDQMDARREQRPLLQE